MDRRSPPPVVLVCALVASPSTVMATFVAIQGWWSPASAVIASLLAWAATWAMLRNPLRDLGELLGYVRRLASRAEPPIPIMTTTAGQELATAVARLHEGLTEESRQHESLAASLEATLDSLPDPLLLLDGGRRVVGANMAAQTLIGRSILDTELTAILRVPSVLDAVDRMLAGSPDQDVEFVLPGQGERIFLARLKRLSLPGVNGARLVLALHDISAARNAERMRAEFVANASHELRTPLASLQGFIETLAGPARDDPGAREQFLPIMLQTANRMARLINDLLSLSRIEFDEHTIPRDPVNLAAVVLSVVEGLTPQAGARGISLDVHAPSDLPPVRGQADQLAQVMQNLIDNAIKYGRPGSSVDIRLSPAGPMVAVAVRDQGEGIARQHLPRLTERFFRCDAARSRELGGTGLGLAIVKHIVNRHRGQLLIDSTTGQGSLFTVRIPVFTGQGEKR